MAEFQMAGPMSEKEVEARFAEHGIDYETRAERYKKLNGTPFATINPNYWIAYYPTVEEGSSRHRSIQGHLSSNWVEKPRGGIWF